MPYLPQDDNVSLPGGHCQQNQVRIRAVQAVALLHGSTELPRAADEINHLVLPLPGGHAAGQYNLIGNEGDGNKVTS